MKTVILLLLLVPCFARAQDIALVDRELKGPMTVTRNLTLRDLSSKLFPIYRADLDSIIHITESLISFIKNRTTREPNMQLVPVGHSQFAITTERSGEYNSYMVFLNTRSNNLGATLELVSRGDNNRRAVQQLLQFLDYLKNNRHMIEE